MYHPFAEQTDKSKFPPQISIETSYNMLNRVIKKKSIRVLQRSKLYVSISQFSKYPHKKLPRLHRKWIKFTKFKGLEISTLEGRANCPGRLRRRRQRFSRREEGKRRARELKD